MEASRFLVSAAWLGAVGSAGMPRNPRFANERLRAAEACRLLNEFVGDLVAGTRSLDLFEALAFASKIGVVDPDEERLQAAAEHSG